MKAREGIALLALIAIHLSAIDSLCLLSGYSWVDELYTYAIAADPSLTHAPHAIHGGMDSMPTHALLMRLLTVFGGDPSEVFLRLGPLGFVVLAMLGSYVLLRLACLQPPRSRAHLLSGLIRWS